jgi:sorbitol-specific phosphotransferase system component IIC
MEIAIQLVWWIGLIGALIPTLIILKEVALVLRTLGEIHRLACLTRDAAHGVASNVSVIPSLGVLSEPLVQLRSATGEMVMAAATIERKVS